MSEVAQIIKTALNLSPHLANTSIRHLTQEDGEFETAVRLESPYLQSDGAPFRTKFDYSSDELGLIGANLRIDSTMQADGYYTIKQEYRVENGVTERTFATARDEKPKYWRIPKSAIKEYDHLIGADMYTYSRPLRPNTCLAMARLAAYYLRKGH